MTTGTKIRFFREKKRLSQEELGFLVGVSQVTIGNWEQGKSIKHEYIKKLADGLGLSANFLLEEKPISIKEIETSLVSQSHFYEALNKKMDFIINRFLEIK